jgi:tetratricopeptide (TPR) repeat protein
MTMWYKLANHFEICCAGIAVTVLLSAVLPLPAHASGGRMEFKAGYSAILRHDHDRAISHFTDAIDSGELPPAELALAYHFRGADYLKIGHDDEAIADFDRALALNPSFPTVYNDRAIAFRHKGDLARAVADYGEAIKLMPRVHSFYLNRGLAYAANGQYEEAIADYKLALYYKPDCVPAFVALGDAHLKLGRKGEAIEAYRQAMRRKGDLLKEYPGVGVTLVALGAMPPAKIAVADAMP